MIIEAIKNLRPNSLWTLDGTTYEGLNWYDENQTKPTKKEVEDELLRIKVEFDKKEYQRNRALEYPSIVDQLDMLWHAINSDSLDKTSSFYTSIKNVKDKYPKEQ